MQVHLFYYPYSLYIEVTKFYIGSQQLNYLNKLIILIYLTILTLSQEGSGWLNI